MERLGRLEGRGSSHSSPSSDSRQLLRGGAALSCPSVASLRSIEEMFLPGRVLHITKDTQGGFSAREVAGDYFNSIIVSPAMMSDHMPNYLGVQAD